MPDAKQKRILLIGVGRWGANHLRILKSMPIEVFVADHYKQPLRSAGVPENPSQHRATLTFYRDRDAGCTYRVFKRECISRMPFLNSAHRFLPHVDQDGRIPGGRSACFD